MNTVRYRYNQQVQPPAPFIYVVIHHPVGQTVTERHPALLDSGADITAVPAAVVDRLGLVKFSDVILAGYAGPPVLADSYVVSLTLHDFDMAAVEVVLTDESYVILGRDILNQFHIALDGLHRRLERVMTSEEHQFQSRSPEGTADVHRRTNSLPAWIAEKVHNTL